MREGETEGERGGNEGKEKVSVWTVSSEEFMRGLETHLQHHTASDGCVGLRNTASETG